MRERRGGEKKKRERLGRSGRGGEQVIQGEESGGGERGRGSKGGECRYLPCRPLIKIDHLV